MVRAYALREGALNEVMLERAFPFLSDGQSHVIALVGGGGKTSLMFALARAFASRGRRTAVTTTTRIFKPSDGSACDSLEECRARWERGEVAVWARELSDGHGRKNIDEHQDIREWDRAQPGKIGALEAEAFAALLDNADVTLVEADGARRMALKAPAAHEPVIPARADIVIAIAGLDVLGKSVAQACFRPELVAALLCCGPDHALTGEDIAQVLRAERGARKGVGDRAFYTVINKADDAARRAQGAHILRLLGENAVMTWFDEEERPTLDTLAAL